MRALPIVLKHNERRSVCVERDASDAAAMRVVKRFHAQGALARSLDGRRARREYAMLSMLARAGFPVPEPIAVRRSARGWELVTQWIAPSVTLGEVLRGNAPWPSPPERVARDLGAMLARAHTLGLDHPDLHSGNVLAGSDGRLWLVDLHGARARAPLAHHDRVRDLVRVAADARELVSERFRARFLASYLRALGAARAEFGTDRRALTREIEAAARRRRRRVIGRSRLRWTRASSVCARIDADGVVGFRSLALSGDDLERFLDVVRGAPREPRTPFATPDGEWIESGVRGWIEALACWRGAARLFEHGIPCARPMLLTRAPRTSACFLVPAGAHPIEDVLDRPRRAALRSIRPGHRLDSSSARDDPESRSGDESRADRVPHTDHVSCAEPALCTQHVSRADRAIDPSSIGALFGALFDRGLDVWDAPPAHVHRAADGRVRVEVGRDGSAIPTSLVWCAPDGSAFFGPRAGLYLRSAPVRGERRAWARAVAVAVACELDRAEDLARLSESFVRAQRSGAEARARAEEAIRA